MVGLLLISALAIPVDPASLMSLPMEDIFCFAREAPAPPSRARVCIELDGAAGMECWPDMPASVPQSSPMWSVRSFTAASMPMLLPPAWTEISLVEIASEPAEGHGRRPEEPPRAFV